MELSADEIKDLGLRIKNKEREAFHTLYRAYFQKMYTYAWRYVYDMDTAKDMVQEAFLSLWDNADKIDNNKNLGAYLITIVKNACLQHLRSIRIHDSHADKIIESIFFSNLEDEGLDEAMKARLAQVMQNIPEKGKAVLLAHFVDRKKIKDIAAELNIAESTVNTHLKRSMKVLRDNLLFVLLGIDFLS